MSRRTIAVATAFLTVAPAALGADAVATDAPIVPLYQDLRLVPLGAKLAASADCSLYVQGGFNQGQILELVSLLELTGPTDDLSRTDAFYFCNETNPMNYLRLFGPWDFGPTPASPPGYGWVVGVGYLITTGVRAELDVASRSQ